MKPGDKVRWTDPLSGMVKHGRLLEQNTVVAKAPADKEFLPGKFKDVHYETWTVRCTDGHRYVFKEQDLTPELTN